MVCFGNIQLLDIPSTGFEAVAVSATVLEPSHTTQRIEKESILFVCIYHPPIHRQEQQTRFLQNLHVMLRRLFNDTSATVVIAGDFNAHCSDWCAELSQRVFGAEFQVHVAYGTQIQNLDKSLMNFLDLGTFSQIVAHIIDTSPCCRYVTLSSASV